MASVTKAVSGATTTFVITDSAGSTLTLTTTTGAVTGISTSFASSGDLHNDGMALLSELALQLQTGLVPGAGAQRLTP